MDGTVIYLLNWVLMAILSSCGFTRARQKRPGSISSWLLVSSLLSGVSYVLTSASTNGRIYH